MDVDRLLHAAHERGRAIERGDTDEAGRWLSVIDEIRAAAQALAVPEGWVLVPVEPTREMVKAITQVIPPGPYDFAAIAVWRAMIAAAPQEPRDA